MLAVHATEDEVKTVLGISTDSLLRCIKREYGRKATFAILSAQFATVTKISVRRAYLISAMKKDRKGNYVNQATLRHAATRFGDLKAHVVVHADPEQHEEQLAAQHAAATVAQTTREHESSRVDAVLKLLGAALGTSGKDSGRTAP